MAVGIHTGNSVLNQIGFSIHFSDWPPEGGGGNNLLPPPQLETLQTSLLELSLATTPEYFPEAVYCIRIGVNIVRQLLKLWFGLVGFVW